MNDLLHSFGCGIAFTVGAFTGIVLSTTAWVAVDKKARKAAADDLMAHYKRVEDRLGLQVAALESIAQAAKASEKRGLK